ncbi:MAG: hypothetical protein WBX03_07265 [Terriglobales bacterium]|jgi:hypothetical protein
MIGRSMILSIVWLLLPFGSAAGQQANNAAAFPAQLEVLGHNVDKWQQTLSGIDIDHLAVSKEESSDLKGSRDSSLAWLQTLRHLVPKLAGQATLSDQTRLLLGLVQFENWVTNYNQELRRAYEASDNRSRGTAANVALRWMNQTAAIASDVQGAYETLSDTMFRRMDEADQALKKADCGSAASKG